MSASKRPYRGERDEAPARGATTNGHLAGYRVVDHGEFITAPYATMLLGDLGAEVIKVERPGGDRFRNFERGLYGPQFQAFNRNKKSLVLDLERDDERAVLAALLRTADVYVHNFRPGVAERLGVGAEAARAINPRLVYCAISGFGPDGPYAQRPAYDTVGQALSGFLSMFVDPQAPRIVGPATADSVSGLYAANGILAALLERGRTGRGKSLHVPMVAAMAHFSIEQYHRYFSTREVPGPSDRGRVAQSFALRCADGALIAIHLSSPPKFWTGLLAAIELRPDWAFARASEIAELCRRLLDERGFELVTPDDRATLVAFRPTEAPEELVERLRAAGIHVREIPKTGLVRVSCGWWTNEQDVERLVEAVAS